MDGVSVASGIAGLITLALQVGGAIYEYSVALRDKPKNVTELHDELVLLGEVLSQLQAFLQSEKGKGRSFENNSMLQRAINDCHKRIERIRERLKPTEGGKLLRTIDRLRWPFEQKDVLQMVENLRRFTNTFQFAVTIEGCNILSKTSDVVAENLTEMLEGFKKIKELSTQMGISAVESEQRGKQLQTILDLIPVLNSTADSIRELSAVSYLAERREKERLTTQILDWLVPLSSLHKHRDVQYKRAPNTGIWLLESPQFLEWFDSSSASSLLCVGGPGVGKTILCSLVIDHIRGYIKEKTQALSYYYCDYAEQQQQSALHFASCLLRQYCTGLEYLPSCVTEFYQKTHDEVKDQEWYNELLTVLSRVTATLDQCFVVVDALDEATMQQGKGMVEVLDAIRNSGTRTKVLATSRPHIAGVLSSSLNFMELTVAAAEQDVRHYLAGMIDNHPDAEYIMDDELRREILERLCSGTNGMFLLPALQIRMILDQVTRSDVKKALRGMSADLAEVFESTLDRIRAMSKARREVAFRTLMWISHARRPLTWHELQHALAMTDEADDIDHDNFVALRTVLASCCGLVEVDSTSATVRLVHFSLEEYLRTHDHGLFHSAHLTLARTCLKYISMPRLDSLRCKRFITRVQLSSTISNFPFLGYSCTEWGFHLQDVEINEYRDTVFPVLEDTQKLVLIARIHDLHHSREGIHSRKGIHKFKERMEEWADCGGADVALAVSFGLVDLVRSLLREKPRAHLMYRDPYGSTSLHEAAVYGYTKIAELLVEHGAIITDRARGNSTPFYLAVAYGQLSTAQALLRHDRSQLEVHCRNSYTPLHKACDLGLTDMVRWLLQQGAAVDALDHKAYIPLHLAARRGHTEIVRLLVHGGSPVQSKAVDGLYPLHLAAAVGHADVTQLLIDAGANVNAGGWDSGTPLHRCLETVQALLDHNAELRHEQLFHKDNKGSTPRVIAFYTANYHIHKFLRAAEWDALGVAGSVPNLITAAIEKGSMGKVKELLGSERSDIEAADEDGQPPLHVALQERHLGIAKYLLSLGASIDSVGYHNWRSLHIASSLGDLSLVELCLANGADLHTRSSSGQTALHKAASNGSVPVLKRLLDAGAEPTATQDRGMTILHISTHHGHLEAVKYLVTEVGIDVLARDKNGATSLAWAERGARLNVAAYLRAEERIAKLTRNMNGNEQSVVEMYVPEPGD